MLISDLFIYVGQGMVIRNKVDESNTNFNKSRG